jgi:UDP-N-acetylglucosamine acyltransferase
MKIHPTAIVDPLAELFPGVEVGPYAIIEGEVQLGEGCEVGSHAVLHGPMRLGPGNRIFPHASIGLPPQDLKYGGEPTLLEIGGENCFREYVSVHRGTVQGRGLTSIGSGNLLMSSCHVAHDVEIGDGCVLSNGVTLGGHVEVHDHAVLGGLTGVHQFTRIGRHAFVGGCSAIDRDVVPFGLAAGNRARLRHYNGVGLRRRGFGDEAIERIRAAFRILLDGAFSTAQAIARLEALSGGPEPGEIVAFARKSTRGVLRGRRAARKEE